MNKDLLRSVMALYGDTFGDLADFLGISPQSVSNKVNEKVINKKKIEFRQGEITAIKNRYGLTSEQVDAIFFN